MVFPFSIGMPPEPFFVIIVNNLGAVKPGFLLVISSARCYNVPGAAAPKFALYPCFEERQQEVIEL